MTESRRLRLSVPGDLDHEVALKTDPHRPDCRITVDEDAAALRVTLSIGALWGQPLRFIEMTSAEARSLGGHIIAAADEADVSATRQPTVPEEKSR